MERAVSLQYIHTNVHTKLQVFFFRKDQNSQDPHERFHRRKIDAVHEKKKNQLRHQEKTRRKESTLENRNSFKNFQLELLFRLTIFFGWSEPSVLFMDLN